MVSTIKFSQFATANIENSTNQVVGADSTSGGNNIIGPMVNIWNTAARPATPFAGLLGFNNSLNQYEYWSGSAWVQLAAGGSGSVNVGTINEIAWYAATGTAISGLTTANNALLVTDSSGAPSLSSTLPSALTIPGYVNKIISQVFVVSGTYTPTSGMIYCIVEVCGGGGGGGASTTTDSTHTCAAAGGGGGGYSRKVLSKSTVGASQAITVGLGGAGGTAPAGNGVDGGTSSFGSLLSASGGNGGLGDAEQNSFIGRLGGAPGIGSSGDINISGGAGATAYSIGAANAVIAGIGGSSFFSGSTLGRVSETPSNGLSYGGGGAGSALRVSSTQTNGGNGITGVVIVTEFTQG